MKSPNTGSITCTPFFAFCCWLLAELKKLPKKLGSAFLRSTSRSLLLFICAEVTFPPLGSGVAGLFAFRRSVTIAMAFKERSVKGNTSMSEAHLVTVEEVRMCRVNIASLHCDHIGY